MSNLEPGQRHGGS